MSRRLAALFVTFFFAVMPAFAQNKQAMQVLALSSETHFEPQTAWRGARWFTNVLAATKTTLYRITCNKEQWMTGWHNGQCGPLVEGHTFKAEIEGNHMVISGTNSGTGKHVAIKFEITDSRPIQFYSARVADRKSNSSEYEYTVPGYSVSTCSGAAFGTATATSFGTTTTANASGFGTANCSEVGASSHTVNYTVYGATLSLLLPDGRIVVVNCDSRPSPGSNQQRNCREPLTDEIQAEFDQDNARLVWSASVDGTTMGVETYKIIGILSKIPAPENQK
jgi:hypothetical protein